MAGAVDVETRGAIEASEGAGGRGACERWVRWYEAGGLEEVARHRLGSGVRPMRHGRRPKSKGYGKRCRTIGEAMAWCEKELGVAVSYKKLHYWFRRWGYRKKVPRPMAENADVQEGWKKGGYWQP